MVKVATVKDGDHDPVAGRADAMDPKALDQAIQQDLAAGHRPAVIIATIGSTSIGAMDDLKALGEVARRHGLYFHVDAAWAGSALICEEYRHLIDGIEAADSFVFNPHKWLLTNFDCTAHFVRSSDDLVKTLGIQPDYLKTQGQSGQIDYSEWSIPLGRRFRALKLWFVIRSYGVDALCALIRKHCRLAGQFAKEVEHDPSFELITPPSLSLMTFRYAPEGKAELDQLNAKLLQAINDDGRIYLTQTSYKKSYVLRFQVGQLYTEEDDVRICLERDQGDGSHAGGMTTSLGSQSLRRDPGYRAMLF